MEVPYHIEIRPKEHKVVFIEDRHNYQLSEYPLYLVDRPDDVEPAIPIDVLLQIEAMEMNENTFILTGVYTIDVEKQI